MVHILLNKETDRQKALDTIKGLPCGQGMWVEVNDKPKRSLEQHRLYWKWLRIIHEETGDDIDSLHEYFKVKFLGLGDLKDALGSLVAVPVSTTSLSVPEFADYLEQIQSFASSFLNIRLESDDQ